jgi:hypothetical protein
MVISYDAGIGFVTRGHMYPMVEGGAILYAVAGRLVSKAFGSSIRSWVIYKTVVQQSLAFYTKLQRDLAFKAILQRYYVFKYTQIASSKKSEFSHK